MQVGVREPTFREMARLSGMSTTQPRSKMAWPGQDLLNLPPRYRAVAVVGISCCTVRWHVPPARRRSRVLTTFAS